MAHKTNRQRILAISTTAIGDTLLGMPALDALGRASDLDMLVHMRCAELVRGRPGIRRLYTYRNNPLLRAWLILHLASHRYDRVVVLHANDDILKLLPWLRYGQAANTQSWNLPKLRLISLRVPEVAHFTLERLRLAAWCEVPAPAAPMRLPLSQAEQDAARDWLAQNGPARAPKGLVAFCPGAARPFKCWPLERFAEVASALERDGYGILVVGSAAERKLYEGIARSCQAARPLLGQSLRLAAAVLARVDLLVTNDTGTMHLAEAVGAVTLSIFGPTPPERYAPQNPKSGFFKVELTCKEECKGMACEDPHCLRALETQTVLDRAREMLGPAA